MKLWGISAVVCCLLADVFIGQHVAAKHRPVYTVSTNQTSLTISWQGQTIVHGVARNIEVAVSPDCKSVAWVITRSHQHPGITNEQDEDATPYGVLYTAHDGHKPAEVLVPMQSRGESFNWN